MIERVALWNQIIIAKKVEYQICEADYGVGVWKAIRTGYEVTAERIVFDVGSGRRLLFWKDKWCGQLPLCVAFPLFMLLLLLRTLWLRIFGVKMSQRLVGTFCS